MVRDEYPELLLPQQLDYQNLPTPIENFHWDKNRTMQHQRFKNLKQQIREAIAQGLEAEKIRRKYDTRIEVVVGIAQEYGLKLAGSEDTTGIVGYLKGAEGEGPR